MFKIKSLPKYVIASVEELTGKESQSLAIKKKAKAFKFPLNLEDKAEIAVVMTKFTKQPFYMGLSGPQLGFLKRLIVFTMPRHESEEECRTKVWLNPSYEKANDNVIEDYECCVSVRRVTAPVPRYETIRYKANDVNGNVFEGEATGLTARVIQHEIDHLDGKLFIDLVPHDKLISMREFVKSMKEKHLQTPP